MTFKVRAKMLDPCFLVGIEYHAKRQKVLIKHSSLNEILRNYELGTYRFPIKERTPNENVRRIVTET